MLDNNSNIFGVYKSTADNNDIDENKKFWMDFLDLKHPSELIITEIDDNNYRGYLNDHKFKLLSKKDQFYVKVCIHHVNMISNSLTKPFYEIGLRVILETMKWQ